MKWRTIDTLILDLVIKHGSASRRDAQNLCASRLEVTHIYLILDLVFEAELIRRDASKSLCKQIRSDAHILYSGFSLKQADEKWCTKTLSGTKHRAGWSDALKLCPWRSLAQAYQKWCTQTLSWTKPCAGWWDMMHTISVMD